MTPCTARYVYTLSEARLSAEFTYAEGTERGEGGENPASDFSANDINKVWYRSNLTGSSLYAVDKNGETVSHAVYNAWGRLQSDAPTDMNFTGMEGLISYSTYSWDVTLELYFAQNRFYDPADKRFTQEDKTEDGVNWYLYVENNPLIFVDADGNMMVPVEKCGGGRVSKPKTARTIPVKKPPVNKPKATPAPSNVTKAVANAAKQVVKTATQAVKNTVPSPKPTPKPKPVVKSAKTTPIKPSPSRSGVKQPQNSSLKQYMEQPGCKDNEKKKSIFGFHGSVTAEQQLREYDVIPESQFYPWVVRSGVRQNELVESDNNSSYVSIYHETRSDAPWRSSVGGKIEIGNFSLQVNGSIDNSGITISSKDDNGIHSFSYKADYTRLEVQLERSSTVKIGENLTETQYDYMTANKLFPLGVVVVGGIILLGVSGVGPAGAPAFG